MLFRVVNLLSFIRDKQDFSSSKKAKLTSANVFPGAAWFDLAGGNAQDSSSRGAALK